MSDVIVRAVGDHDYEVRVSNRGSETNHRVRVPDGFLDQFDGADLDEVTVVEESFAFLLEREPATSIMGEFALTVITEYFPDYPAELRRRLSENRSEAEDRSDPESLSENRSEAEDRSDRASLSENRSEAEDRSDQGGTA